MSSQLKLNCLVLGDGPSHVFSIDVSGAEDVSALRELIKEKKSPSFNGFPANDLVLWKVSVPVDQHFQANLGRLSLVEEESLLPVEDLSNIFSELPLKRHLHIVVQRPPAEEDRPRKRRRLEPENVLPDLRIAWKQPLPMLDDLKYFLQIPLQEDQKIPIDQNSFDKLVYEDPLEPENSLTETDLSKIFRVHDLHHIGWLAHNFIRALQIDVPPKDANEATFHHFWDTHIRDIMIAILGTRVLDLYRNSSYPSSTLMWRPDFWSLIENLCLFRGEESPYYTSEDPRDELSTKLAGWPYSPAPYIFGYYARGAIVTFVAMTGNQDPHMKPNIHDLCFIDLAFHKNRIRHLLLMIHMVSLLPTLAQLIGGRSYPEYCKLQRDGSKTMELQGTKVMKVYFDLATCVESVKHLERIYGLLEEKRVPHTDRLVDSSIKMESSRKKWPYVRTSPLGDDRRPRGRDDILNAVMCILRALIVCHSSPDPIVHRDIRWENVIRDLDPARGCFLIDWEHASCFPTMPQPQLNPESHCPTVYAANHGFEVDVWAVGRLLYDVFIIEGGTLFELGQSIMDESLTGSLDANAALEKITTLAGNESQ